MAKLSYSETITTTKVILLLVWFFPIHIAKNKISYLCTLFIKWNTYLDEKYIDSGFWIDFDVLPKRERTPKNQRNPNGNTAQHFLKNHTDSQYQRL